MKSCHEYQELISRLLDEELSDEEQREVERHIASCPECAALYDAFRSLSNVISEDMEEPPARLHETVMADVRREALRRRQAPRRVRSILAVAACAALVLLGVRNLPRMGASAPDFAASQAAPEAAFYPKEAVDGAETERKDAANGALYAEPVEAAEAPAAEVAEAPAAAAPSAQEEAEEDLPVPYDIADAEPEAPPADDDFVAPGAAVLPDDDFLVAGAAGPADDYPIPTSAAAPSFAAVWPYLLIGLPLIAAAVLLLLRRRGGRS